MNKQSLKMPDIFKKNVSNKVLVEDFLSKYRLNDPISIPSNLPTACTLKGVKAKSINELKSFEGSEKVFVYWDEGDSLRIDKIQNIIKFWENRNPWEDYDFCIFPESLDWCIGLTHNDYCVLVE